MQKRVINMKREKNNRSSLFIGIGIKIHFTLKSPIFNSGEVLIQMITRPCYIKNS